MARCKAGVISRSSVFMHYFCVGFRKVWSTEPSAAVTSGEYCGAGGSRNSRSSKTAVTASTSSAGPARRNPGPQLAHPCGSPGFIALGK